MTEADVRRECPMCGESMFLEERQEIIPISGTSQTVTRITREWVCKECDYFEEADVKSDRPSS